MVIGFGSVAVLGRLLTPDHFGLVAIATSLMVPVSALCDHGMPLALIQRKSPTLSETNAMFWLQCSLGFLAAVVGAALAYPLGAWLDRPELFWILMAFSGNLALAGFGATHLALIRRDLRFRTHAGIGVLANLCAVFVGILAAYSPGYWSGPDGCGQQLIHHRGRVDMQRLASQRPPKGGRHPGHGSNGAVPEWHRAGLLDDQSG